MYRNTRFPDLSDNGFSHTVDIEDGDMSFVPGSILLGGRVRCDLLASWDVPRPLRIARYADNLCQVFTFSGFRVPSGADVF